LPVSPRAGLYQQAMDDPKMASHPILVVSGFEIIGKEMFALEGTAFLQATFGILCVSQKNGARIFWT
jgi:hypothetical protein